MYFLPFTQPNKFLSGKMNKITSMIKNTSYLPNSISNPTTQKSKLTLLTKTNSPKNNSSPIESKPIPLSKATYQDLKKPT